MKYIKMIKKYVINAAIIFILFFVSTMIGISIPNSDKVDISQYNDIKAKVEESELTFKEKQNKLEEVNNNIKSLNNEIGTLNNEIALEEE